MVLTFSSFIRIINAHYKSTLNFKFQESYIRKFPQFNGLKLSYFHDPQDVIFIIYIMLLCSHQNCDGCMRFREHFVFALIY